MLSSVALLPSQPSAAGVPWTLPPLAPDAEISQELFSHCSQPLFTSAELQEWQDTLDQSVIYFITYTYTTKRAWLNTCAGVLGADAMEVEMEEQGEGQEEVEVLDEVS
jgi:hypothetical protein